MIVLVPGRFGRVLLVGDELLPTLMVTSAYVSATLANDTTAESNTNSSGLADPGLTPLRPFHGMVTNLGVSSGLSGDAPTASESVATACLSCNFLGVVVVAIAVVTGVAAFISRTRSKTNRRRLPRCGAGLGWLD